MSLVTVARYRTVTLDTGSSDAAVTGALVDAQALLEDDLGRQLEQAERTERLYPDGSGRLYPIVTPITAVSDGYRIDGATVYGGFPFLGDLVLDGPNAFIDLVYTGGYVERTANPTAANRLPSHVEADICWGAYFALNPSPVAASVPVGATSVRLGDAAVSFGPAGPPNGADGVKPWSKATLRLKRAGRRI